MNISFKPSSKSPYVFSAVMRDGLKNAEQMEIVISVTSKDTIGFRIFPQYKGAYITSTRQETARNCCVSSCS